MKRIGSCLAAVAMVMVVQAQVMSDTLLMKVGGVPVSKDEFVYAYHKNQSQLTVDAFLQRLMQRKREVCMAYEWRLEQTPAFLQQMEACEKRVRDIAVLSPQESEAPVLSQAGKRLAHFCMRLPQKLSAGQLRRAEVLMDSLYRGMKAEGELALWIRHNRQTFESDWSGETFSWDACLVPKDLEKKIAGLPTGALSQPWYSAAGLHVFQWTESDPAEGDEPFVSHALSEKEARYLLQEYHDGLLAALLADSLACVSEKALTKYYKKHKKQYYWELPHYKGIVLQAEDAAGLDEAAEYFRKIPRDKWSEACRDFEQSGRVPGVKVEYGLFCIGESPCVDKQVFGQGSFAPDTDYPYVRTIGKVLKKKPENYRDVRDKVMRDYLVERQKEMQREAQKRFKVEINQEVLKTVNNCEAI